LPCCGFSLALSFWSVQSDLDAKNFGVYAIIALGMTRLLLAVALIFLRVQTFAFTALS
jgi:hypothetical protein